MDNPSQQNQVLVLGQDQHIQELVARGAKLAGQVVRGEGMLAPDDPLDCTGGGRVAAIVVSMDDPDLAKHASAVRSRPELAAVPMLGVAKELGDLTFGEAYSIGIDDCCVLDEERLARRLRQLDAVSSTDTVRRGRVIVIADENPRSRLLLGRVFRGAAYSTTFANTPQEALEHASQPDVAAVVVSAELEEVGIDGCRLTRHLPQLGEDDPARAPAWIINTPPKGIPRMLGRVAGSAQERVVVHDAFAAPATLLFVVNDVLNQEAKDARKSERLLYGTSVRFRPAGRGRSDEDFGYSYNLSAGGLYVRSLALPANGQELWLEFVPPRSDRVIHLEATALWTRGFGPGGAATVPSGFGVEMTGASSADAERYDRSYRVFLGERAARHASTCPPKRIPQAEPEG